MFKKELSLVPHLPGCYLMRNKDNIVIYVGKSKNLKNRLSSYFQREHTGKTMMLVREIDHFEYIITNTEMESLLLKLILLRNIILSIIFYIEMISLIHILNLLMRKYPLLRLLGELMLRRLRIIYLVLILM